MSNPALSMFQRLTNAALAPAKEALAAKLAALKPGEQPKEPIVVVAPAGSEP